MEGLSVWIEQTLEPLDALGLVLIAFLDSSFISLPEVNDILVITLSMARPERMPLYALAAAFGSVGGCLALHFVGRQGGLRLLRKKLSPERLERLRAVYRRFDVLTILVPSMLPPPCPFKIFVLASGVFGMRPLRFVIAVAVGRSVRYLVEGWAGVRYGEQTLDFVRDNLAVVPITLGVLLVAGLVIWWRFRAAAARERAA